MPNVDGPSSENVVSLKQIKEGLISRLLYARDLGASSVSASSQLMLTALLNVESFAFRHYLDVLKKELRPISEMFDDYYVTSTKRPLKEDSWFFFNPQTDRTCLWLGYYAKDHILFIPSSLSLETVDSITRDLAISDGGWIIRDGIIPHPTKQEIKDACS